MFVCLTYSVRVECSVDSISIAILASRNSHFLRSLPRPALGAASDSWEETTSEPCSGQDCFATRQVPSRSCPRRSVSGSHGCIRKPVTFFLSPIPPTALLRPSPASTGSPICCDSMKKCVCVGCKKELQLISPAKWCRILTQHRDKEKPSPTSLTLPSGGEVSIKL